LFKTTSPCLLFSCPCACASVPVQKSLVCSISNIIRVMKFYMNIGQHYVICTTWDFACRFGQSHQSYCPWLSQIGHCQIVSLVASTVFELRAWSWNFTWMLLFTWGLVCRFRSNARVSVLHLVKKSIYSCIACSPNSIWGRFMKLDVNVS
jgi:hypothetical protein